MKSLRNVIQRTNLLFQIALFIFIYIYIMNTSYVVSGTEVNIPLRVGNGFALDKQNTKLDDKLHSSVVIQNVFL
jgi:hypothetical protein